MQRQSWLRAICVVLAAALPVVAIADTVTVPFGTTVYCQLDEQVTSRKHETSEGDIVRAHVWKDVRVDGRVVIEAGTPVFVRVSDVQKARIAGRKGRLELEALNVRAVDGSDVTLDGGYDKSGKGKVGLSIALAAVVAWPLIFLKGKQAILEPGALFDSIVRTPIEVTVAEAEASERPKLTLPPDLEVAVLYDELDPDAKIKDLPLELRVAEGETIDSASIVSVNDNPIAPLAIELAESTAPGVRRGTVDFKKLSKTFELGMNRFEVKAGDYVTEVLLEIEF